MHHVCGLFIRPDASGCEHALHGIVVRGGPRWLRVFFFDDKGAASVLAIECKRAARERRAISPDPLEVCDVLLGQIWWRWRRPLASFVHWSRPPCAGSIAPHYA